MIATLCINCGQAPRDRRGYRRCRNCYEWRRRHAGQERPATLYARHERRCAHCACQSPRLTLGLCHACYVYQWRTGAERPATLYAGGPRRCLICAVPVELSAGRRCYACAAYRRDHHGAERPAALYQRRRCGQCSHYLPAAAPAYQTLCGACAVRWHTAVNAGEVSPSY